MNGLVGAIGQLYESTTGWVNTQAQKQRELALDYAKRLVAQEIYSDPPPTHYPGLALVLERSGAFLSPGQEFAKDTLGPLPDIQSSEN